MFSLLPEEYRKKLHIEYRIRLSVIGLFGILALSIIAGVFLLPTYLRVSTENNIYLAQKQALEKEIADQASTNSGSDISTIKQNMKIAALDDRSVISAISATVSAQSKDIKLMGFTYNSDQKATSTLVITGIARSRQALQLFKKNLSAQKIFTDAVLPISDYAKDSDIPFSINLSGYF